jgi:hypothetical protein
MPAAGEASPADTEASHEPNATRTAKKTPDAAPRAMASLLIRARLLAAYRPPRTTDTAGTRRNSKEPDGGFPKLAWTAGVSEFRP